MFRSKPEVKIIADSVNATGDRLTTFQLKYWRPILPEMNTHRIFSRNAASSRARSLNSRIKEATVDTWVPDHWNAEQRGMEGGKEFSDETKFYINTAIQNLAQYTANYLQSLNYQVKEREGFEIHKQYINRYLEPFIPVVQLVSSTDWNNFFHLRLASDAQPEIKDVAGQMYTLLREHIPEYLTSGNWHLPYITKEELNDLGLELCKKISVARCARVSYKEYEGNGNVEKDVELYDRLLKNGHMSPFEHIATPDVFNDHPRLHGNYFGWSQLRHVLKR